MGEIHERLFLIETVDNIYIHPATKSSGDDKILVINRINDELKLISYTNEFLEGIRDRIRTVMIGGIIGVINLLGGPYLIVIRGGVRVGEFARHVIWQLNQFEVISFRRTLGFLMEKQTELNNSYLEMISSVLETPHFYYSTSYDLSLNLQTLENSSPAFFQQTLLDRSDEKFIWNFKLLSRFEGRDAQKFCMPLIHGFASITPLLINSQKVTLILISRRSVHRAGTRLFARGIDSKGHVGNFVETEQLIQCGNDMSSFIQIRGSVPLYWQQRPNLRYKPRPTFLINDHETAFGLHFDELIINYNKIAIINLVNQTGAETVLETEFSAQTQRFNNPGVTYHAFDFHHECRNMKWENTEKLINRLMEKIEGFGYFMRRGGERVNQEGVFRTNCVDCLDRTNVIQGLLARINLEHVLTAFGVIREGDHLPNFPDPEGLFKNVWADNGDVISTQYSGTGALKSDFTRTGKRSMAGVWRDGVNSTIRYFKNNFSDGYRTDAINLFLCKYRVLEGEGRTEKSPLQRERDWRKYALPAFLALSFLMLIYCALPRGGEEQSSTQYWLPIFVCGSAFLGSYWVLVFKRGRDYVDNPVLRNEDEEDN